MTRIALLARPALSALLLLGLIPAAGEDPTRIAVCDLNQILSESEMSREKRTDLETLALGAKKKVDGLQEDIEKIERELPLLDKTAAEYKEKEATVKDLRSKMEASRKTELSYLFKKETEFLKEFYQQTTQIINAVAKERGFDIVLQYADIERELPKLERRQDLVNRIFVQTILYSGDRVDITKEVLKRLDADYRKSKGQKTD